MIGDGKLLTNAHCVEHDTQVYFPLLFYLLLLLNFLSSFIRLKLREEEMIESTWLRLVFASLLSDALTFGFYLLHHYSISLYLCVVIAQCSGFGKRCGLWHRFALCRKRGFLERSWTTSPWPLTPPSGSILSLILFSVKFLHCCPWFSGFSYCRWVSSGRRYYLCYKRGCISYWGFPISLTLLLCHHIAVYRGLKDLSSFCECNAGNILCSWIIWLAWNSNRRSN